MRIDWKNLPHDLAGFDALPHEIDWSDPTHIPLMVASVARVAGCPHHLLTDEDANLAFCLAALDAMAGEAPAAELVVRVAIEYEMQRQAFCWLAGRGRGEKTN